MKLAFKVLIHCINNIAAYKKNRSKKS